MSTNIFIKAIIS